MPHMRWIGVDIAGATKKGIMFAHSPKHLEDLLYKKGIALISFRQLLFFKKQKITSAIHACVMHQLATLLEAGIVVSKALLLCADRTKNRQAQELLYLMEQQVRIGGSFSSAVTMDSVSFNPLIKAILCAGDESGNLASACYLAADFFEMRELFFAQIRSVIIMPLISLLFVGGVAIGIGSFVIPRSVSLYASIGKPIPVFTQTIMSWINTLFSWQMVVFILIVLLIGLLCMRLRRFSRYAYRFDYILLNIPFFGSLITSSLVLQWLQSLALLTKAGIPLPDCLLLLNDAMGNKAFCRRITSITHEVLQGESLSYALMNNEDIFLSEVAALVIIGEEASMLSVMLEKAANLQKEHIKKRLRFISVCVQPILLLLLGCIIAALIFALYIPIISFADVL